jgi:major vault protein
MSDDNLNKSEFILSTGEYGFYLDKSKGNVLVMVGPYQKSLTTNTESPMRYDANKDRLVPCTVSEAQLRFPSARQGQYIILENPAADGKNPAKGGASPAADLQMGRKVNLAGPIEFPLFPMQRAVVLDGHQLRTDQYLIVRVYDEEEAKKNKGNGFTLRVQKPKPLAGSITNAQSAVEASPTEFPTTLGHQFLVKGTVVAFYIPPTGYEVVPQVLDGGRKEYVRTAVSLECLEYCTLLDEGGNRRIEKGPQVVFPEPTETFVTDAEGNTKFRAIELDEIKGLYVKVTEDYVEGEGDQRKEFKRGQELFITGSHQRIYFPRTEHAIVSYGGKVLHYGIAIPSGEGRYVLRRKSGEALLVEGPKTYLPNPIEEVVIRRVLTSKEAELLYPNNQVVATVNAKLREAAGGTGPLRASLTAVADDDLRTRSVSATLGGGAASFDRGSNYTPPRTITLDSKFDGAVRIDVWPGFAVMVVNGKGARRVVKGPSTTLLEYDETPHRFTLSTGTPKSNARMIEGVYLQTAANSVSDRVDVETRDLCKLSITLSYKVNFEGDDPEKWFAVADYIGLLTASLRSILRKAAKQHGVLEFLQQVADIVRNTILGKAEAGQERKGKVFAENNMRVYDVDVLDVVVEDAAVGQLITAEQLAVFKHDLKLAELERQSKAAQAEGGLAELKVNLGRKLEDARSEAQKAEVEAGGRLSELQNQLQQALDQAKVEARQKLAEIELQIAKAKQDQVTAEELAKIDQEQKRRTIEVEAQEKLLKALGECKLPEALMHVGEGRFLSEISENLSIQAMLGGRSLVEVLAGIVKGTPLAGHLAKLTERKPPGQQ